MASRNPQRWLQAAVLSISLSAPQTQNTIRSHTRRRCEVFFKKKINSTASTCRQSCLLSRAESSQVSYHQFICELSTQPSPSPSSPSSSWSSVPSICHRQKKMELCPRFRRDRRVTESCATRERVMFMNFSSVCRQRSK